MKKVLDRILGFYHYKTPIIDKFKYTDMNESYCGGALAGSSLLLVTNDESIEGSVSEWSHNECFEYKLLKPIGKINWRSQFPNTSSLYGGIIHVVNMIRLDEDVPFYNIYQWHQEESDFLISNSISIATICTVVLSRSEKVIERNVEMLIKGLAEALSSQQIVCNGIIANKQVPLSAVLNSVAFLSGKYGQIMSGEVLKMNCNEEI